MSRQGITIINLLSSLDYWHKLKRHPRKEIWLSEWQTHKNKKKVEKEVNEYYKNKAAVPIRSSGTVWASHSRWCPITIPLCIRTRLLLPLICLNYWWFETPTCHKNELTWKLQVCVNDMSVLFVWMGWGLVISFHSWNLNVTYDSTCNTIEGLHLYVVL